MVYKGRMADAFDKVQVVVGEVEVRLARPDERRRWDALMDQHHYLGFRQFAGRGCVTLRCGAGTGWRYWAGSRALSSTARVTRGWASIDAVSVIVSDREQHPVSDSARGELALHDAT